MYNGSSNSACPVWDMWSGLNNYFLIVKCCMFEMHQSGELFSVVFVGNRPTLYLSRNTTVAVTMSPCTPVICPPHSKQYLCTWPGLRHSPKTTTKHICPRAWGDEWCVYNLVHSPIRPMQPRGTSYMRWIILLRRALCLDSLIRVMIAKTKNKDKVCSLRLCR